MRSLKRNPWPVVNGNKLSTTDYHDFKSFLQENFGFYCCYCESSERKTDIEHAVPKSVNRNLECNWNNLLVACAYCNRDYKKNYNDNRNGYIWPDLEDTFSYLEYKPDGSVSSKPGLSSALKDRVDKTIDLMNLNPPIQPNVSECKDALWCKRLGVWNLASTCLNMYKQTPNSTMISLIVQAAVNTGFWSVWMTVFKGYPNIAQEIAKAFPGTHPKYK